ncbi:unnamed protein product [Staurois parvus]|uniref:Uncharacterized protein n=1 Tax=Staurois parvus TaxID=386267 RepID=A0ABN9FQC4_9NEOB|nr:unnamed protein product [Staurois parvus]
MTPKGRGMTGLVVLQQLEDHQFDSPALGCQTGGCQTGPSSVGKLQLPSCLYL